MDNLKVESIEFEVVSRN